MLDELTNYLDLNSLAALERVKVNLSGTIIINVF